MGLKRCSVCRSRLLCETDGLLAYMENPGSKAEVVSPTEEEYSLFFSKQLDSANNIIHLAISGKVEHSGCQAAM